MKTMTFAEAIRNSLSEKMRVDDSIVVFGEDVGAFGGSFGVTAGMFDEFGEKRVKDTPISEGVIVGCAVGAAATGLRPVPELMFADFLTVGMDQLVNQAAKMRYMFGGSIDMPIVLRLPLGAGISAAAQHSQSTEAWVTHVPGLKVVYPSTPEDAYGLMLTALEESNPVCYFEHKLLYTLSGEVSGNPIPFGKADIKREGSDVTVIATGQMVHEALAAAEELAGKGVSVEVLDPRTLYPLDEEAIAKSIEKTNKVLIVSEENKRGAYSGEIAAIIAEKYFDSLDAPIIRLGALNSPVPFSPALESVYLPNKQDIVNAIEKNF